MCTVTYIPTHEGFYLTSSRDEAETRATLAPAKYWVNGSTLFFPKDGEGGGTWIAVSQKAKLGCILNGAFRVHKRREKYKISRGQILIKCLTQPNLEKFWDTLNLQDTEPFTLLILDFSDWERFRFYELRWDETNKYFLRLDPETCHIWSSVTLYNEQMIKERESWFTDWIKNNEWNEDRKILDFHFGKHTKDSSYNILMKRSDKLRTVSITNIFARREGALFKYYDLVKEAFTEIAINNFDIRTYA